MRIWLLGLIWIAVAGACLADPIEGHMVLAMGEPDKNASMALLDPQSGTLRTLSKEIVTFPRLSRDGQTILYAAVAGDEHLIKLYDLSTGSSRILVDGPHSFPMCWLADGGFVANQNRNLGTFDAAGQRQKTLLKLNDTMAFGDVGGETVYLQLNDAHDVPMVESVPLAGGSPKRLCEGSEPRMSPDGKTLVYLLYQYVPSRTEMPITRVSVNLYTLSTGHAKVLVNLGVQGWASSPVFSPDGTAVAYVSVDKAHNTEFVRIVDVATGRKLKTLPLPTSADHLDWGR